MTLSSYIVKPLAASAQPLTAQQVAKAYNYPTGKGDGRTIAIIELGGGYSQVELTKFFGTTRNVVAVDIAGGSNTSDGPNGADGEVLLDIEVALSVAQNAACRVYFCPNTDAGFLAAIEQATNDLKAGDAITISWGGPESSWNTSSMDSFNKAFAAARAKGINVFCAAGDSGADDGTSSPVADFPSSSPNVVSCGGTRLVVNADGSRSAESAWNDSSSSATGGGVSRHFPGRQVPDVAGNADPNSGYEVLVDGQRMVVGGTSAVAPLYAGLSVILTALVGPFDFLTAVTSNPTCCYDVTVGDNGAYRAGPGRDEVSGFGVVDGSRLLALLGSTSTTPTQPTQPTAPTQPTQPTQPTETETSVPTDALNAFLAVATDWVSERHTSHSNKNMQQATETFIAAVTT